jgi:hypothetical protein
MLVLGLVNDTDLTFDGVVFLENINDNLNIQFANLTEHNSEYLLKIFLDYNEIDFEHEGNYKSDYIFTANSGESLIIPISLSEDNSFDSSRILTVAIFTAPDKHAYEINLMSNQYGVVMSYELANKNRTVITNTNATEPSEYLSLSFQGLMLNFDFSPENNMSVKFPPYSISTKENELIEIAYRAGKYENVSDIIIVVMVNWNQQKINGMPYLHLVNKPDFISFGSVSFIAPAETGKYDVVAFVVESPYSNKNADNFHFHDKAYRFTLIVE